MAQGFQCRGQQGITRPRWQHSRSKCLRNPSPDHTPMDLIRLLGPEKLECVGQPSHHTSPIEATTCQVRAIGFFENLSSGHRTTCLHVNVNPWVRIYLLYIYIYIICMRSVHETYVRPILKNVTPCCKATMDSLKTP